MRSNARVHGFEDKTEYLVPGCMDLKKNKISCTGVHESEEKNILMYSVDSIKRTIHLAFHGLLIVNSIFNRDFLKFFLATVFLIEQYA